MANGTTTSLASRLKGELRRHAKYCGLILLENDDPAIKDLRPGECLNSVRFVLRGERDGRLWTVDVSDPDDGVDG